MSAYRSTLPKRSRPIEAADFKRAPNLSVHANSFAVPDSMDGELNAWNRSIPFLPQTVMKLYEDSFQTEVHAEIHFISRHDGEPVDDLFSLNIASPNDEDFTGSVKFLHGQKVQDEGSSFQVMPEGRGKGLGKAWLKSMVELTLGFGNDDLWFDAGDENGAYTWARAGIPMRMAPESAIKRTHLSMMVIGRLEAIRPMLSPADYHFARAMARFVMKDDVNRLAEMTAVVPVAVYDDLQKRDSDVCRRMAEFYALHPAIPSPLSTAMGDKSHLLTAFEYAVSQKGEISVPRYLLANLSWEARIDFSDAHVMQKVGAYLGGWNTIRPDAARPVQAFQL